MLNCMYDAVANMPTSTIVSNTYKHNRIGLGEV